MSYLARQLLAELSSDLEDAAFWERWQDRLHPDEARAVARGEIGLIRRRFEPEWTEGEWLEVASNLWMRPHKPRFTPRRHVGWRVTFDLRDFRVQFSRRVPPMFEPPEVDEDGRPIPPSSAAIEAARLSGNYTASHALSVPDCPEAQDEFTQRRITEKAKADYQRRRTEDAGELLAAMEDLRSAIDELPEDRKRRISRTLWQLRARLDSAEREMRRRLAA